jgi:hypothetical protein
LAEFRAKGFLIEPRNREPALHNMVSREIQKKGSLANSQNERSESHFDTRQKSTKSGKERRFQGIRTKGTKEGRGGGGGVGGNRLNSYKDGGAHKKRALSPDTLKVSTTEGRGGGSKK